MRAARTCASSRDRGTRAVAVAVVVPACRQFARCSARRLAGCGDRWSAPPLTHTLILSPAREIRLSVRRRPRPLRCRCYCYCSCAFLLLLLRPARRWSPVNLVLFHNGYAMSPAPVAKQGQSPAQMELARLQAVQLMLAKPMVPSRPFQHLALAPNTIRVCYICSSLAGGGSISHMLPVPFPRNPTAAVPSSSSAVAVAAASATADSGADVAAGPLTALRTDAFLRAMGAQVARSLGLPVHSSHEVAALLDVELVRPGADDADAAAPGEIAATAAAAAASATAPGSAASSSFVVRVAVRATGGADVPWVGEVRAATARRAPMGQACVVVVCCCSFARTHARVLGRPQLCAV
jgi:hypothetical protein